MSSPFANRNRSFLKRKLITFHQRTSHHHRISVLSKLIAAGIQSLKIEGELSVIDIGCGDMKMLYRIKERLPLSHFTGLDIYELPESLKLDPYWRSYQPFDGHTIPLQHKAVRAAMLIDVLHHLPQKEQLHMVREAGRVADYVIIKDHFEYGFFSRQMLRLMDVTGNWAYGVSVPDQYFSKISFERMIQDAGLEKITLQIGIDLYDHHWLFKRLLQKKWHFLYIGKSTG